MFSKACWDPGQHQQSLKEEAGVSRRIRAYSLGMILGAILVTIPAYPTGSAFPGELSPPSAAAFCRVEAVLVRVNTLQECAGCGNEWFYSYRYDPVTIDFIHRRVGLKLIARAEEWDERIPDIGERKCSSGCRALLIGRSSGTCR